MKYAVLVSRDFEKRCERLLKKYRSLSSDLEPLVACLSNGDFSPDFLVPLEGAQPRKGTQSMELSTRNLAFGWISFCERTGIVGRNRSRIERK